MLKKLVSPALVFLISCAGVIISGCTEELCISKGNTNYYAQLFLDSMGINTEITNQITQVTLLPQGKVGQGSLVNGFLLLPLDPLNSTQSYVLKKADEVVDTITISSSYSYFLLSKACGYAIKSNFEANTIRFNNAKLIEVVNSQADTIVRLNLRMRYEK